MSDVLQTPLAYLKGVGPARAMLLQSELGLATFGDLLMLLPHRYIDKTNYYKINEVLDNGADVQVVGVVTQWQTMGKGKSARLTASFTDGTGVIELIWFRNYKWVTQKLTLQTPYVIFGKAKKFGPQLTIAHPEFELLSDHKAANMSGIQPVYPSTEKLGKQGISQRVMSAMVKQLFLATKADFPENLNPKLCDELKLMHRADALLNIHFPKSPDLLQMARFRLKFEELFFLQLQLIVRKSYRQTKIKGMPFEIVGEVFNDFFKNHLPFELTKSQKRVVKEIRNDLGKAVQMNRLLQGDVGSGKTMVGLLAMLIAIDNGYQACLMAPTEILAQQHFNSISQYLKDLSVTIKLLTGSTKKKDRTTLHEELENGELQILIGTHALLEDKVKFQNLGLAIIDEQHRFGVAQRSKLYRKNKIAPHVLFMTATPIPRTLQMSIFGDLDVSVIDELPPGRKPIETRHKFDSRRLEVFHFMKQEIKKGRQIYVVYPLIEESEALDYKDLMDGYESIAREFPQPEYQISIVHGRMKQDQKDYEMQRFARGETQIMVATTVIEVGVNVPNASVMIIESAEKFGLSQLHQLRGRVGRGAEQSYCILMTSYKLSDDAKTRLETMCRTNDGFEIAEVDLDLRGPGDIMGTQQSGMMNLKIADIVKDGPILRLARNYAISTLKEDPKLEKPENQAIAKSYQEISRRKGIWGFIG